jgi:hypothetical protein
MKKILIVVSIVIAFVVLIVAGVFYLTSGITDTADRFFGSVKKGDMQAAAACLSEGFRASTPQETLESFLRSSGLNKYKDASWSDRSITGKTGEIEGSIETTDGGTIPIKIGFVKEKGGWKILSIQKVTAGLVSKGDEKTVPDESSLRSMTDNSLQEFARAVNKKDFTDFYNGLSELWKSQTTSENLRDTFKVFIDNNVDLTIVKQQTPVFSKTPEISSEGALELEGYYPTKPSTTYFKLTYIYEHPAWKLAGIRVTVK